MAFMCFLVTTFVKLLLLYITQSLNIPIHSLALLTCIILYINGTQFRCSVFSSVQYIISPRARSQANIKRKIYWEILFKGKILLLIITSQNTRVQHNKMTCRVQTLVCMDKVKGKDNNSLKIHNHRLIQNKCPRWQDNVSHMSKAEVTGHFCCWKFVAGL